MKAKIRLFLIGVSILLIPILLYFIRSSFVSKFFSQKNTSKIKIVFRLNNFLFKIQNFLQTSSVVRSFDRDEFVHNVHLRKLNQPFEWHNSQDSGIQDPETKDLENFNLTSTETKKKPSTCRNSVQGKVWIADDQGN